MTRKLERMGSMKTDRELIELAKTKPLETLGEHFQRRPEVDRSKGEKTGLVDQAPQEAKMKLSPRLKGQAWTAEDDAVLNL